jgi:murein DD-endopeptidase MepM/ murein hydrolase activator NlpD
MKMKSGWKLEVIKSGVERPFAITISKPFGIGIIVLLLFAFVLSISSLLYIYHNQYKIAAAEEVLEENRLLKTKLSDLSAQIDTVFQKLQTMEEWEDEIRAEKNLKQINKEIRKMGIGGIPRIDSTFSHKSRVLNAYYNVLLQRLTQIESRVDFTFQTHNEVLENMHLKDDLYRSTPSIYPTFGRITEAYGYRTHPITKKRTFHYGLDIANLQGKPIYATADGVVENLGRERNFGNFIHLKHNFGYETKYAHLHKIYVAKGQSVKRGDIIGTIGNTGRSTGSHLHYEVKRYNKHRNPYYYLNKSQEDIILTKK